MKKQGIYFKIEDDGSVSYVGKTTNLSARLARHQHIVFGDKYKFLPVPNESDMAILELAYIDKFKPNLNKIDKFKEVSTLNIILPAISMLKVYSNLYCNCKENTIRRTKMKQINIRDWVSDDDIININMLKDVFGIDKVSEQLLNRDAMCLDEIVRENNGILLGKIKNGFAKKQFVKINKHEWACNWYWSYGHIVNNNMSCGLDRYYDKTVNEAFEHTWMTDETWNKFRIGMKELGSPLGYKEDVNALGKKLDALWNDLIVEYKKVELIMEEN